MEQPGATPTKPTSRDSLRLMRAELAWLASVGQIALDALCGGTVSGPVPDDVALEAWAGSAGLPADTIRMAIDLASGRSLPPPFA